MSDKREHKHCPNCGCRVYRIVCDLLVRCAFCGHEYNAFEEFTDE